MKSTNFVSLIIASSSKGWKNRATYAEKTPTFLENLRRFWKNLPRFFKDVGDFLQWLVRFCGGVAILVFTAAP